MKLIFKKGIGLVEMVVGLSVFIFIVLSFIVSLNYFIKDSILGIKTVQANFLIEEGLEAIKTIRNDNWISEIQPLISGQEYYINFNGTKWEITTSSVLVDNFFERKFMVEDVYRDANGDISSSGTLDSGSKKITVFVSYTINNVVKTENISTIISDIFGD